jgi:hypothetical protein
MWWREGRQLNPTPKFGRWETQEAFQSILASQESCRNLTLAWQCKAAHKFEDMGSHHIFWVVSVTSSPYNSIEHPQFSTDLEPWMLLNAVRSLRLMKMWFAQWGVGYLSRTIMVLVGHRQIYSSLAQGRSTGRRLCEKIGYCDKPTPFIVHNFHNLEINVHWEKTMGHYFLGNTRKCVGKKSTRKICEFRDGLHFPDLLTSFSKQRIAWVRIQWLELQTSLSRLRWWVRVVEGRPRYGVDYLYVRLGREMR